MDSPDFVLTRRLTVRSPDDGALHDGWVRFKRPYRVEAAGGSDLFRVDIVIESPLFEEVDHATGMDDVSAILSALVVAKGNLAALMNEGYHSWWLQEGDLDEPSFWGFQVHL